MPATVRRRSSMSRNDMWQPEQPSSHTVARRFLLIQTPFTTKDTKVHKGESSPTFPGCTRKFLVEGLFVLFVVKLFHSFSSRIMVRYGRNCRRLSISAT